MNFHDHIVYILILNEHDYDLLLIHFVQVELNIGSFC